MFYIRKSFKNLWAISCIAFGEILRIPGGSGVLLSTMFKNLKGTRFFIFEKVLTISEPLGVLFLKKF